MVQYVLEYDQPAQAVPQEEQWLARLLLPHQSQESMQVLSVLFPSLDIRPLTPGPAVAAEVHGVDGDTSTLEVLDEGRVQARVIPQAMDVDQHGPDRPPRAPDLPEE